MEGRDNSPSEAGGKLRLFQPRSPLFLPTPAPRPVLISTTWPRPGPQQNASVHKSVSVVPAFADFSLDKKWISAYYGCWVILWVLPGNANLLIGVFCFLDPAFRSKPSICNTYETQGPFYFRGTHKSLRINTCKTLRKR